MNGIEKTRVEFNGASQYLCILISKNNKKQTSNYTRLCRLCSLKCVLFSYSSTAELDISNNLEPSSYYSGCTPVDLL